MKMKERTIKISCDRSERNIYNNLRKLIISNSCHFQFHSEEESHEGGKVAIMGTPSIWLDGATKKEWDHKAEASIIADSSNYNEANSHRKNIGQFWRKVPEEQGTKSSYIQTPDKKLFLELCQDETSPCAPSATLSLHGQKELGSPLGTHTTRENIVKQEKPISYVEILNCVSKQVC